MCNSSGAPLEGIIVSNHCQTEMYYETTVSADLVHTSLSSSTVTRLPEKYQKSKIHKESANNVPHFSCN